MPRAPRVGSVRTADGLAVLTPLMRSREPAAGWFAFATDVDTLRMFRWRLTREQLAKPGDKPRERWKLTEAECSMVSTGDAAWSRPELVGYPDDLVEASAMLVARFDALTRFQLTAEVPQ